MAIYDINGNKLDAEIDISNTEDIKFENGIYALKRRYDGVESSFVSTNTSDNLLILAHITDIHCDVDRYTKVIQELEKHKDYINAIIMSGDLVDTPNTTQYGAMTECETGSIPIYKCVGNHDRAFSSTQMSLANIYSNWNCETNTGKLYHYVDFATQGVRVIFLNQYDTTSTSVSVAGANSHYSQDQIDWFVTAMQGALTNGYAVLIVYHTMAENAQGSPIYNDKGFYQKNMTLGSASNICSGAIIADIVHAFQTAGSVSQTYTFSDTNDSVTVSASFASSGTFIGYVYGHAHVDQIGYSQRYANQLCLRMAGLVVDSSIGRSEATAHWKSRYDVPRMIDTPSEIIVNLYGIDPKNKLVKVLRIGSDVTHDMEERKMACFSFLSE